MQALCRLSLWFFSRPQTGFRIVTGGHSEEERGDGEAGGLAKYAIANKQRNE